MQLLTMPMPLSPEVIDDRVATVLDAGANITLNYDDAANVLTISAATSASGAPTDAEYVTSTTNGALSAERVLTDTATVTWDRTTPGQMKANAAAGYTDEQAQDAVGNILQDSATIDYVYNDTTPYITGLVKDNSITESMLSLSDNITKDSTVSAHGLLMKLSGNTGHFLRGDGTWVTPPAGTSYTDEQAQDAIGTILADSTTIDFTYNDATPSITASVIAGSIGTPALINDSVTYAKIQNVTDNHLLGRSAGSAGDIQEITVGTGLSLSAGALTATGGGGMTTEQVEDIVGAMLGDTATIDFTYSDVTSTISALVKADSITFFEVQNVSPNILLGRSATDTGNIQEITVGTGLTLAGGTLSSSAVNDTSRGTHFLFMGA